MSNGPSGDDLLVEPDTLEGWLDRDDILVVDLSSAKTHQQYHVPGAVFLEYARLVADRKPVGGLLPEVDSLVRVLSETGIGDGKRVIAYDDEGGGKACRLLWTLDCLGFDNYALLNGGLHSWAREGHKLTDAPTLPRPAHFQAGFDPAPIADASYIKARLEDPEMALVDTRTREEYTGERRYAERGGHIPGAVHFDWLRGMDQGRNLRFRDAAELRAELEGLGIGMDRRPVVYCQTHHRSSHTYVLLKYLGYHGVKGYHGAWSDWGNRPDTPVETDT